jgi:predicted Zn-dependent protease
MIWNAFYQLVKALNNVPGLEVGHPNLQILSDQVINAQFDRTTNSVKIQLALVELLADSPSEIAWVIAHELGHAHQRLRGTTTFDRNVEHDADFFSLLGLLLTGYDVYAAGGALGKLLMASERTGLLDQLFDDIADPHSSFPTRMSLVLHEVQTICGLPQAGSLCTTEHTSFHPHMPTTATPLLREAPPGALVEIQSSP